MSLHHEAYCGRRSNRPPEELVKQVLKHEIVHAFLVESGLAFSSHSIVGAWAMNEEMVDWIAWNGEKLYKAWKEAGLVD